MDRNKNENITEEIPIIPEIEVIKSYWERERLIWLGCTTLLAKADSMVQMDCLMDTALDLGLIV